jgi:hypothetical protein
MSIVQLNSPESLASILDLATSTRGTSLPVIQRPLDNTAMSAYMACPREYSLSMVEHRRGKGKKASLVFGSGWHKALETHYKTGGDRARVQTAVMESWEDHGAVDDYRTFERVLLDYDLYVKKYGPPEKEAAKTVGYPTEPLVEIATNAVGGGLLHPYAGKLDRIIEFDGDYYVEDHKTTSRLDKHYFSQFNLSNQMLGYTFLGQQLLPGVPIRGVRINLSHVLTNKTEFHREFKTFNKAQIEEWVRNTNFWMELVARSTEGNIWPAHFGDNGCSRKFGMCTYHEACSIGDQRIRQRYIETNYEINPWNPLEVDDE